MIVDTNLCRAQYTPTQQQKRNITTKHKEQFVCPKGSKKSSFFQKFRSYGEICCWQQSCPLHNYVYLCGLFKLFHFKLHSHKYTKCTYISDQMQIKHAFQKCFFRVYLNLSGNVKNCNVPTFWNFPLILYAFNSLSTNN